MQSTKEKIFAPVPVCIRENVRACIGHGSSKSGKEYHVLDVIRDQDSSSILLAGSLLAVLVHKVQQRVHVGSTRQNAVEESPEDNVKAIATLLTP